MKKKKYVKKIVWFSKKKNYFVSIISFIKYQNESTERDLNNTI